MNTNKADFSIQGMHCSSCALIIEKSLNKVDGVKEAHVNFASEKASIIFDASVTKEADLIKTVKKAGYRASIVNQNDSENESKKRKAEINNQFKKFIFSATLSLPMLSFMFFKIPYAPIISLILASIIQFVIYG